jgi:hypothetical protein
MTETEMRIRPLGVSLKWNDVTKLYPRFRIGDQCQLSSSNHLDVTYDFRFSQNGGQAKSTAVRSHQNANDVINRFADPICRKVLIWLESLLNVSKIFIHVNSQFCPQSTLTTG